MINIVGGHQNTKTPKDDKPEELEIAGTSSSFFILPFRYEIKELINPKTTDVYYEKVDTANNTEQWTERIRYFTRETSCVLFKHAQRYRINDDVWEELDELIHPKSIKLTTKDKDKTDKIIYEVKIEAPEIILFENHSSDFNKDSKNNIFQTGFLIVKTHFVSNENKTPPKYEHLLHFNERFRYWRKSYDNHDSELLELDNLIGNRHNLNKEEQAIEMYLRRWQRLLTIPYLRTQKGKQKLYQFIPDKWCEDAEKWFLDELRQNSSNQHEMGWIIYSDTRTFVWSNAVIKNGASSLKHYNPNTNLEIEPEAFGHWLKLLNVDALSTYKSKDEPDWWDKSNDKDLNYVTNFEKLWGKNRTYKRWAHYGTLYGFNYHSGVMLSAPCCNPPLSKTFRHHYFDMIILLLYLRVSIFRFSNEMNKATIPAMAGKNNKDWEENFLKLRKDFAFFTNLYQFPLISNQQQMLEMYQIARENLDINELFKEVEDEIKNTHEYFSIKKTKKLNTTMYIITVCGIIFATLSIAFEISDHWFQLKKLFHDLIF